MFKEWLENPTVLLSHLGKHENQSYEKFENILKETTFIYVLVKYLLVVNIDVNGVKWKVTRGTRFLKIYNFQI